MTDEFLDYNSSYGYYKTGQWLAWDFNLDQVSHNLYAQREERAWIYRAQVAQVFHWLPPTEAAARSVSAIWGIISIIVLYFAAAYFTKNKIIGLISAFLFSVSVAGITFDRMLRMYAMFFPVFLLFSWFIFRFFEEAYKGRMLFVKTIQDKLGINVIWLLPAILSGIISWHLHLLTANIGAIFIIYLIIRAIEVFYYKHSIFNKYTAILLSIILLLIGFIALYNINPENISIYSSSDILTFSWSSSRYLFSAVSDYSNAVLAYALIIFGIYSAKK